MSNVPVGLEMRDGVPYACATTSCRLCGNESKRVGAVHGRFSGRDFELRRCPGCRFAFIADPLSDLAAVYDERYYAGQGADRLVDYRFELEHPDSTVRAYEWRGIERVVSFLVGDLRGVRWLDYGCGNGGLVRHLRQRGYEAHGFEEGAIAADAAGAGVPIVARSELDGLGEFDVVTAIEVLEHVHDPLAELRSIRNLLRPGGLLFLTTGNAAPFAGRLAKWSYVVPEIHISFFEPGTLELALSRTGFRPELRSLGPGFDDVLKFKVLKNLRVRRRSALLDRVPPRLLAAPADRYARLSDHPIGWAIDD
jgi:2-polyprenyl-3-methyl-5-hydroxy-6-metoxy-1,4-benzoquinol methylase